MLAVAAVALLALATIAFLSPGTAEDATEQRLDDLETRVAALETQVAATAASETGTPGQDGQDGEAGQPGRDGEDGEAGQDSSSSSSTQQSSGSFTGVYSGSGDRVIEIELDNGGSYQLTLNASGPTDIVLTGDDGPVEPFGIETDAAGTTTRTANLAAGTYRLDVRSSDSWSVTLLLLD
jgi:hypothetical protein